MNDQPAQSPPVRSPHCHLCGKEPGIEHLFLILGERDEMILCDVCLSWGVAHVAAGTPPEPHPPGTVAIDVAPESAHDGDGVKT